MDGPSNGFMDGRKREGTDRRKGRWTDKNRYFVDFFFVAPENRDVTLAVNENGSEEAKLTSGETPIGMRRKSTQFKPPKLGP